VVVRNSGDAPLTGVAVSDPAVPACASTRPVLAPGESYTTTCTAVAPLPGDANTATVSATDALARPVTATATAPAPTPGSITGRVFADVDDDGVAEPGDTGIGGATVALTGTTAGGAPLTRTTTTAADGTYAFAGVPAGTYRVVQTQPAAFDDGRDRAGTSGVADGNDAVRIVLPQGGTSTGTDFAELPTSSLAGAVHEDVDGDGVRDAGEPGPRRRDRHRHRHRRGGQPRHPHRHHRRRRRLVRAAAARRDLRGHRDAARRVRRRPRRRRHRRGALGDDVVSGIALPARTAATGYTFGETRGAGLSGRVVDDTGTGLPGVVVTLTGTDGAGAPITRTATTAADGSWAFGDLPPGVYAVVETQPAGYGDGPETVGTAGGTAVAPDRIEGVVLASAGPGAATSSPRPRSSLAGAVYRDDDADGVRDEGEPGIPGTTMVLDGPSGVRTAVTGPDGGYVFTGLLAGTYTLTETQPAGLLDGRDTVGTAGGTPTPPDTIDAIALPAGTAATGYLFGEVAATGISGAVLDDAGGPIADVTVTLTGTDDLGAPVSATTTTSPTGAYSFPGLRPGTYALAQTQPPATATAPTPRAPRAARS
jgi:hypothetical protein